MAVAKRDAELREAFQLLDRDGDGLMRVSELRVCLVSLGVRCTEGEFKGVLREVVKLQRLKHQREVRRRRQLEEEAGRSRGGSGRGRARGRSQLAIEEGMVGERSRTGSTMRHDTKATERGGGDSTHSRETTMTSLDSDRVSAASTSARQLTRKGAKEKNRHMRTQSQRSLGEASTGALLGLSSGGEREEEGVESEDGEGVVFGMESTMKGTGSTPSTGETQAALHDSGMAGIEGHTRPSQLFSESSPSSSKGPGTPLMQAKGGDQRNENLGTDDDSSINRTVRELLTSSVDGEGEDETHTAGDQASWAGVDLDLDLDMDSYSSGGGYTSSEASKKLGSIDFVQFKTLFRLIEARNIIANTWYEHVDHNSSSTVPSVNSFVRGSGARGGMMHSGARDKTGGRNDNRASGNGGKGAVDRGTDGKRRRRSWLEFHDKNSVKSMGFSTLESELLDAFKIFDDSNDGFITSGDLFRALNALMPEESVTKEDCVSMVAELSSEKNEKISFSDFTRFLLREDEDETSSSRATSPKKGNEGIESSFKSVTTTGDEGTEGSREGGHKTIENVASFTSNQSSSSASSSSSLTSL